MRHALAVPLLVLLIPAVSPAQQQPAFYDSMVVTATGEPAPVDATAAAATVIEREEIEASGEAGVAELLRRVAGATVLRSGRDGGVTTLFMRGTAAAHTLVLLDGVRLNSPFFGGYDWSLPMTAGLERIEVVRGPYSALYGADAIGGVVQLVPARGGERGFHAVLEGGSEGWRRADAEAAARLGGLEVLAVAAARDGGGTLVNDDFSARTAMLDLSHDLPGAGRIGALARWSRTRTEVPFSGATPTPHRSTEAEEVLVALPSRFAFGSGELEVTLDHVERSLAYRDPDDPFGFVASDTDADSDGVRAAYRLGLEAHRLAFGGEWRRDEVTDVSSYGVSLGGERITTRSLFAQDSVTLPRGFAVLMGARWDEAEPWGDELSPRVVASWSRGSLRVWLSHGRAFRAPSLGELYYPMAGNPVLAPERSRASEVGVSLPLVADALRCELVAFSNRIEDLIDFDFATYRYANTARAAQDGVEVISSARLGSGRWLAASVTWLDARDGHGAPLLRRPQWSGSATFASPLVGRVTGELSLVWVGRRDDVDPVTFARVAQPSFVTADAVVALPVTGWLTVRARADNLADRSYEEVRGYPAPGRRLFLGVEFTGR